MCSGLLIVLDTPNAVIGVAQQHKLPYITGQFASDALQPLRFDGAFAKQQT
jgi:hypothetical protein